LKRGISFFKNKFFSRMILDVDYARISEVQARDPTIRELRSKIAHLHFSVALNVIWDLEKKINERKYEIVQEHRMFRDRVLQILANSKIENYRDQTLLHLSYYLTKGILSYDSFIISSLRIFYFFSTIGFYTDNDTRVEYSQVWMMQIIPSTDRFFVHKPTKEEYRLGSLHDNFVDDG
jgi:hypothetical protein